MLTTTEIDRFFKAKKIGPVCSSCGGNEWIYAAPPDAQTEWALASVRNDGSVSMPSPSIPAIVLMCGKCFAIRMHAFIAVKKWLDENPS